MKFSKAFITGINGFVGKHLVNFLLSKEFEVFGIDISDNFEGDNRVKYYKANILDLDKLKQIIDEIKPKHIFHLAGFSSVKKSFEQPELCKKINISGTKNLLDSILEANINPKILIISSADVYGIPKSVPIPETAELNPISPYGESRKEQEELCREYMEKLQIIISRSFPHIGPGQQPIFVASDFAKQIAEIEQGKKESIIKVGNLEAKRDFTDARDVVKAYFLVLEKGQPREIYNVCSGNTYLIKDILNILLSLAKVKITVEQDPTKMRPSDIPILQGDNSKFVNQTGWHPEIPIEKTLKDILDYWREKV
jgi:GDP-4-dehydro-6-deoxy-D-mannose reductase